jgi:hypothetical protein
MAKRYATGFPLAAGADASDLLQIVQGGADKGATAEMLALAGVSANVTQQYSEKLDGIVGLLDVDRGPIIKNGDNTFGVPVSSSTASLTLNSATYNGGINDFDIVQLTGNGTKTITLDASYTGGLKIGTVFYLFPTGTGTVTVNTVNTLFGQTSFPQPNDPTENYLIACFYVANGVWLTWRTMTFIDTTTTVNFSGTFTLNGVSIGYSKIAKDITLSFPDILATSTNANYLTSTALPAALWPAVKQDVPCRVTNGGVQPTAAGLLRITTAGVIEIYRDLSGAVFGLGSNCGLQSFDVSYRSAT